MIRQATPIDHDRFLYFLVVSTLALSICALWLARSTLGDGALWEYTILSGDYAGLRTYLLSAYWYLIYGVVLGVKWFEEAGLSHVLSIKLLTSSLLVAYAFEVRRWCRDVLAFDAAKASVCAALALLIGPWYFLTNTLGISQLLCIYLGLLGHRLLWAPQTGVKLAGVLVCIAAFQLNSNLVFILVLQGLSLYTQPRITRGMWAWTLGVIAAAILVYIVLRFGVPRGQLHLSYNEFLWPTNRENIFKLLKYVAVFGSWGVYPLASVILAFFIAHKMSSEAREQGDAIFQLSINQKLMIAFILVLAAVFPYIVVGKGFALFTPTFSGLGVTERALREVYVGWYLAPTYSSASARHALMLAFPLSVLSVLAVEKVAAYRKKAISGLSIFLIVALLPALFAMGGYWNRLSQLYAHEQLVAGLGTLAAPPAGLIELAYAPKSDWFIWVTDGNVIARRAWGKSHFFSMMSSTSSYADDLKWQYNAYYKNFKNKIPEDDLQGMFAMNNFPGEACLTKYQATLPAASLWHVLLGQWAIEYVKPAVIRVVSSDCLADRVVLNPTPNKIIIP